MNAIAPHMLKCNVCRPDEGEVFRAPNDSVGIILMTAHLQDRHSIEPIPEQAVAKGWVKPMPHFDSWHDLRGD